MPGGCLSCLGRLCRLGGLGGLSRVNKTEPAYVFSHVCAPRLRRLHRLHRLQGLGPGILPVLSFAGDITSHRRWRRGAFRPRRREPSTLLLLLAGIAVFAFVKMMSLANDGRRRTTAEKVVIGIALVALGAMLMSFRRSAARRGW